MSDLSSEHLSPVDGPQSISFGGRNSLAHGSSGARQGGGGSPAHKEGLTPALFWRALRHWWHVVVPLGLVLAAGAGAVVWARFQPMYRAAALVRVKERPDYIAFKTDQDGRFYQNQIELIRSPIVLERVLADPAVAKLSVIQNQEAPLEWLEQAVVPKSRGGSELLDITLAAPDPAEAKIVVNAVLDAYLSVEQQDSSSTTKRVLDLLELEREKHGTEVERLRTSVRTLTKQVTGVDPDAAGPAKDAGPRHTLLDILQEKLATVQVDLAVQEVRLQALQEEQSKVDTDVPDRDVDALVEGDAEYRQKKQELEMKKRASANLNAPRYKAEIEPDERRLRNFRMDLRTWFAEQLRADAAAQRTEKLDASKKQVEDLRLQEKLYKEKHEKQVQNQIQGGDRSLELESAKSDLTRTETVFQKIAERIIAIETEQWAPEQVRELKRAVEPVKPEEIAPYRNLALVCLACLMFPFALSVAWERFIRRISDAHQLSSEANLPVVGEVASLPVRRLSAGRHSKSLLSMNRYIFEESIDSLRTTIVLTEELRNMKVLAVVSSVSREGKTCLAAQLAVSLARATNEPVLVVDADMRSPDLHKIFDVPCEPGLAKVLDRRCAAKDAIVASAEGLLSILPAGKLRGSPHALLGKGLLKELLDEVRPLYRYIIIDTPPVLSASESLVFAKAADEALICTMREVSRAPQVRMTYERLVAAGVATIGVVLNGVPSNRYASKYGSYSYSRGQPVAG